MFMFRNCRKNALVKKLLRLGSLHAEAERCKANDVTSSVILRRRRRAKAVLCRLGEDELEALQRSLESSGATETSSPGSNCISPPETPSGDPVLALWQFCRGFEANGRSDLIRLPFCKNKILQTNQQTRCCNPFHWSLHFNCQSNFTISIMQTKNS